MKKHINRFAELNEFTAARFVFNEGGAERGGETRSELEIHRDELLKKFDDWAEQHKTSITNNRELQDTVKAARKALSDKSLDSTEQQDKVWNGLKNRLTRTVGPYETLETLTETEKEEHVNKEMALLEARREYKATLDGLEKQVLKREISFDKGDGELSPIGEAFRDAHMQLDNPSVLDKDELDAAWEGIQTQLTGLGITETYIREITEEEDRSAKLKATKEAQETAEKEALVTVRKALEIAKKRIRVGGLGWLDTANNGEYLADMTNPWKAWGKDSPLFKENQLGDIRKNLQQYVKDPDQFAAARKLWRGEMVQLLANRLAASTMADEYKAEKNGEKFEKILAAQKVSEKDRTPRKAVDAAQRLNKALNKRADREKIAKAMEGGKTVKFSTKALKNDFPEIADKEGFGKAQVLAGDRLVTIPMYYMLHSKLELEHVALVGDKLYGQVKNGCEGNLVIIDVKLKS